MDACAFDKAGRSPHDGGHVCKGQPRSRPNPIGLDTMLCATYLAQLTRLQGRGYGMDQGQFGREPETHSTYTINNPRKCAPAH